MLDSHAYKSVRSMRLLGILLAILFGYSTVQAADQKIAKPENFVIEPPIKAEFDMRCYFALKKVEQDLGGAISQFRIVNCDIAKNERRLEILLDDDRMTFGGGWQYILSLDDFEILAKIPQR